MATNLLPAMLRSGMEEIDIEFSIVYRSLERLVHKFKTEFHRVDAVREKVEIKHKLVDQQLRDERKRFTEERRALVDSVIVGGTTAADISTLDTSTVSTLGASFTTQPIHNKALSPVPVRSAATDTVPRSATAPDGTPTNKGLTIHQELEQRGVLQDAFSSRTSPDAQQQQHMLHHDPTAPPTQYTMWHVLLKYLKEGQGNYDFKLQDVQRMKFIREAKMVGLDQLAVPLFDHNRCVVSIRQFEPPLSSALKQMLELQADVVGMATTPSSTDASSPAAAGGNVDAANNSMAPIWSRLSRRRRGILYYLATMYGSASWQNPHTHKLVSIKGSSTWAHSDIADIVNKDMGYFTTLNKTQSWVCLDMGYCAIVPTHYSFTSCHPIYSGYYPRYWEFQASTDNKEWVALKRHNDDRTITRTTPFGCWTLDDGPVEHSNVPYRYFRILQTGSNSFGSNELQVSALELYGRFIFTQELVLPSGPPPALPFGLSRRPPSPPPELLIEPTANELKKTKKRNLLSRQSGATNRPLGMRRYH